MVSGVPERRCCSEFGQHEKQPELAAGHGPSSLDEVFPGTSTELCKRFAKMDRVALCQMVTGLRISLAAGYTQEI